MIELELKDCPFCGGQADYDNEGNGSFSQWIECTQCGARTEGTRESPFEAWNKRVVEGDDRDTKATLKNRVMELERAIHDAWEILDGA